MTALHKLTAQDIEELEKAIPTMPEKKKRRTLELIKTYKTDVTQKAGK
jgi:hypothetical protein